MPPTSRLRDPVSSKVVLAAVTAALVLAVIPAGATDSFDAYRAVFEALPATPPIPDDNPMTVEKVRLGKMLYWDRRVSKTGATSCGFCHHPTYHGAEPMRRSVGIDGEIHLRTA